MICRWRRVSCIFLGRNVGNSSGYFPGVCFQCLFLLWCMAPMSWNGSQIIYNKVVRPVFLRHEATVDNMVSDLSGKAMSAAENLTREGNPAPVETQALLFQEANTSSSSWVLSTLVKNKTLVTPMPPVAPPEPKSLPSSTGETSNAKAAPREPSEEERRVRKCVSSRSSSHLNSCYGGMMLQCTRTCLLLHYRAAVEKIHL